MDKITDDIFACAIYRQLPLGEDEPQVLGFIHEDGAVDIPTIDGEPVTDMEDIEILWLQGLGAIVAAGGKEALWDYAKYCCGELSIVPVTPQEAESLLKYGEVV